MASADPFATTVPIIYLVMLKIADISREMDLGNDTSRIWMVRSSEDGSETGLGAFSFYHLLNIGISMLLLQGLALNYNGTIQTLFRADDLSIFGLLTIVTVLLLLLLPVMEVKHYSQIDPWNGLVPVSLIVYWICSLPASLSFFSFVNNTWGTQAVSPEGFNIYPLLLLVSLVLFFVGNMGFFGSLSAEMEQMS